ncbi:MAG: flagellar motor switch protein FliG [Treponema sp.]|jgi:flagellar motor switch protein FliG|nr:flagellar motor switch protein FliG [Treponema sp.]
MGKSKKAENSALNPMDGEGVGNLSRGLAAYQRVLKKAETVTPADDALEDDTESGLPQFDESLPQDQDKSKAEETRASIARLRKFLPKLYGKVPAKEKKAGEDVSGERGESSGAVSPRAAKKTKEPKYRRVAKFLILIGSEQAARVMANLDIEQVEAISREIAQIRGVSADEAETILEEFQSVLMNTFGYSGVVEGGVEAARRLLYVTFGPEKGEALLQKSVPGAKGGLFDFLEDFSGAQIALLLRAEAPSTVALVLSRLSPKISALTLEEISPDLKASVIKRLAYMQQTSPDVLKRVAAALREKARRYAEAGGVVETTVDGLGALTAILKHADLSFGDKLLNQLDVEDPQLSQDIKERLYTLEDVVLAENKPIQEKLRSMSDFDIALLVKGRQELFVEKILSNVSANRRAIVLEEQELMGPVRRRDIDTVAHEFLDWFRKGRENGEIFLFTDEDVVV